MRNLETCTGAAALMLGTLAALLLSPAVRLVALVISGLSFGVALERANDRGE
jgi:hypothetical protein